MDAAVTIQIQGLEELKAAFAKYPQLSIKYITQALDQSGNVLLKYSQLATQATLPQKTGKLRSAFVYRIDGLRGTFYVDPSQAPYAIFVHEGTKPHDIYPVRAMALAFPWVTRGYVASKSGRMRYTVNDRGMVFFKHVHHPGTAAHPFMEAIAVQSGPEIVTAFQNAFDQLLNGIATKI